MEIPSKGKGFRVDEVQWSKLFRYILVTVKSIDADFCQEKVAKILKAKAKSDLQIYKSMHDWFSSNTRFSKFQICDG